MRVMITGAAGFIGRHLWESLLKEGHEVTAVDRKLWAKESQGTILVDVRNRATFEPLLRDQDLVFHLAGATMVGEVELEDEIMTNTIGTLQVLKAASKNNVPVVFTSSGYVYGEPQYEPIDEGHPTNPTSGYGISKLAAEGYCRLFAGVTIARLFNVYGPGQKGFVVPTIFEKLNSDPKTLTLRGTGKETRDFIYVSDAVRALKVLARENLRGLASGQIYNVGSGSCTTIRELAEAIVRTRGTEVLQDLYPEDVEGLEGLTKIVFDGSSDQKLKGIYPRYYADCYKIKSLGWEPKVSLEQGLVWTDELSAIAH